MKLKNIKSFKKKKEESFKLEELVKRKKDGKIGKILIVGLNKFNSLIKNTYRIDFYDKKEPGITFYDIEYTANDIEKLTKEEIELYNNSKKFGL